MLTHRLTPFSEERRLVTVMFADLQGFTSLAETLDTEELSDWLNRLWSWVDGIIARYHGRVDKHLGDGIMAVWGAPRATEEDAERAVSCALTIQRKFEAALGAELARAAPVELKLRIGINSGSVIATTLGTTGEYSVIGDAVNIAQRLQSIAPAGGVVVGPGTYRLVRDAFSFEPMPLQQLRGKTALVDAFLALAPEPYPARVRYRAADSLDMHMVGREQELARLQGIFERVAVRRKPRLAVLIGEAGIGKSRLLLEFTRQLELASQHPLILSARALTESEVLPFSLWESLWTNRLNLVRDEPEAVRQEKFARGVLEIWGKELGPIAGSEAVHILGYLAGVNWPTSHFLEQLRPDPLALRERAAVVAAELLRRAAEHLPAVLVLDDLQHADSASLDLVDLLLTEPDLPLVILGASRIAPADLRTSWHKPDAMEQLFLDRLPLTSAAVISIFPRANTLPEAFLSRLAKRAQGNPYFLEEMVKAMLQTGVVISGEEGWHLTGGQTAENIPLPDSLRVQLQARLDALSPAARGVALAASVVGRTFWTGSVELLLRKTTVTNLLPPPADQNWTKVVDEALDEIQRQELAFERLGSTFAGEREFIFKHPLLRATAYHLLPRKYRKPYHALVATWLAKRAGPDYGLMIAEHFARAGRTGDAARHSRLAAEHLRERGYLREAEAAVEAANRYAAPASETVSA